ncbi:MAG: nucleoside recognition protein [Rikenellaceae bacterium]|nr:nucleoside recognition protein [Rikenellaceae bacterium]
MKDLLPKIKRIIATASPRALKTILWIVRLTAIVSFCVFLMQYTGLINWISAYVSPLFHHFGLRGDAAIAFVSGYFINIYTSIAVIETLDLTVREITILATMSTAAHAIIVEGAVLHKTGTPTWYTITIRTLAAIALGFVLNLLLPDRPAYAATEATEVPLFAIQGDFWPLFIAWAKGMVRLAVMMSLLIYLLNILQRILYEFGVMARLSRLLRPLLALFGLPEKCSFLWIVANVIGLSYGSAAMLDEVAQGNISRREINLLNTHIGISHSNLEDLLLYASIGGIWWVILLSRWVMTSCLVWGLRGYYRLRE